MSDWEEGYSKPADITSRWLHDYCYNDGGTANGALRVTMDNPMAVDVVYSGGEIIDVVTPDYKGFMVGGVVVDDTYGPLSLGEFTGQTYDSMGRLRVDAEISIQATELDVNIDALDGDSASWFGHPNGNILNTPVPVNVTTDGVVRVVQSFLGIETNLFNSASIPTGVETTLISYTVPAVTKFHVLLASCSGEADGVFTFKKNGAPMGRKRNSWSNRNVEFEFLYGLKMNAGDVIEVSVLHNNDASCQFDGNFYGENDS